MNKTELLALAERLDDAPGVLGMLSRADLAEAASILRKLAALEPALWQWTRLDKHWSIDMTFNSEVFVTTTDSKRRALFDLTGIIDHE